MKVVITSATEFETRGIKASFKSFKDAKAFKVSFHESGVGILNSTYSLTTLIRNEKPDILIQVGIAGCFDTNIELGSVVVVKNEFLGDAGVEEKEEFKDLFDLNLDDENEFPFNQKRLFNRGLPGSNILKLPEVTSITINEITTRPERIEQLKQKYNPTIEGMEGASLHYVGLITGTPFIQIRAISNYVGERDKTKWQIETALNNLQTIVFRYINELYRIC